MNVIEDISQKLTGKDWSLKEKERFLYLESCKAFSYDNRYFFLPFLADEKQKIIEDEMRNKTIDLEHVNDHLVICTTHTREVLKPLYQKLLGVSGSIEGEGHTWLELPHTPYPIRADAILGRHNGYDIARVKMNLNTVGFRYHFHDTLSEKEKELFRENFKQQLFLIDKIINYVDKFDYSGKLDIQLFLKNVKQNASHFLQTSELIRYVFALLEHNIMQYPSLHFSDVETFLSNYINNFIDQFSFIINDVHLFQISNSGQWNFATIYVVQLNQEKLFFALNDFGQKIQLCEITKSEATHYAKHLDGYSQHLILDKNCR